MAQLHSMSFRHFDKQRKGAPFTVFLGWKGAVFPVFLGRKEAPFPVFFGEEKRRFQEKVTRIPCTYTLNCL